MIFSYVYTANKTISFEILPLSLPGIQSIIDFREESNLTGNTFYNFTDRNCNWENEMFRIMSSRSHFNSFKNVLCRFHPYSGNNVHMKLHSNIHKLYRTLKL